MHSTIIFRTLFEYNRQLFLQVWESVKSLSIDQFTQEIEYSRGSLRNQMVHVAAAEKRWLLALQGDPNARSFKLNPLEFPNANDAYTIWDSINTSFCKFVDHLREEDLERTPPGLPGLTWQVLLHVINHGTDHRAQILHILHNFDASTFDQDFVTFLWDR